MSKYQTSTKGNTIMTSPTDIEKENLEAHVELCAERYNQLETRLSSIEKKVANLQDTIEKSSLNTIKVLIGTAGTVIVGMLSMLAVIITKIP
jgi:tetrahydromethanopterin S-methyltransferase subunit G